MNLSNLSLPPSLLSLLLHCPWIIDVLLSRTLLFLREGVVEDSPLLRIPHVDLFEALFIHVFDHVIEVLQMLCLEVSSPHVVLF